MTPQHDDSILRLAIPKGRMMEGVTQLMRDAGVRVTASARDYRPSISMERASVKLLKPQNIIGMLAAGARDIGFAGADWVRELDADLVEMVDTGLDPVRLVAAAPEQLLEKGRLPRRPLVVASEYAKITTAWMREAGIEGEFIRTWGATEVFPPDDADCIVDNTASGSTLRANNLHIVDELMTSSTRLYANPRSLDRAEIRARVEELVLLLRSVLEARSRVMVDLNVGADRLDAVVEALPCMRCPTVSPLDGSAGYAVRAAVPRVELAKVIPLIKSRGATDIVVSQPAQILV